MGYTHVVKYDGGVSISSISNRRDISVFANPLHRFNGHKPWALGLEATPDGMSYPDMVQAGIDTTEYLQAAGSGPEAITVEIRKPGGQQWGADWVRYVVGRPHEGEAPLDVPFKLPRSIQLVSGYEVFGADEAAELFYTYYQTGDIPARYSLRPVEGYTAQGGLINLRDGVPRPVE
jgi:hypothetical protein